MDSASFGPERALIESGVEISTFPAAGILANPCREFNGAGAWGASTVHRAASGSLRSCGEEGKITPDNGLW